jgi:hypothetical protein
MRYCGAWTLTALLLIGCSTADSGNDTGTVDDSGAGFDVGTMNGDVAIEHHTPPDVYTSPDVHMAPDTHMVPDARTTDTAAADMSTTDTTTPADTTAGPDTTTPPDVASGSDVATGMDVAGGMDVADTGSGGDVTITDNAPPRDVATDAIILVSNNGIINCYGASSCDTTASPPLGCCDERVDGGYIDQCVSTASMCTGSQAKFIQCTDPSDCANGICCGSFGTSSSGRPFFNGSVCAQSCTAPQLQLCIASGDCVTGSCVPATISGLALGRCM